MCNCIYKICCPCINTYAQISFLYVKYFTQTVYGISFIFAVDNAIAYVINSTVNGNAHIWHIYIYIYIHTHIYIHEYVCVCGCGGMYVHLRMDVTV